MKNKFLYYFTKINTYIFFFCLIYFIPKTIVGGLFGFNNVILEIIYMIFSVCIIKMFISIDSPYTKN